LRGVGFFVQLLVRETLFEFGIKETYFRIFFGFTSAKNSTPDSFGAFFNPGIKKFSRVIEQFALQPDDFEVSPNYMRARD